MLTVLLPLLCLITSASAQVPVPCARPVLKLLRGSQEIPAAASALVPTVTLRVVAEAGCPEQQYRFRHVQVTLVRRGRPVLPTTRLENAELNLQGLLNTYQTGDHLLVFVAYQDVALVSPNGSLTPLAAAQDVNPRPGQLDLRTDDSRGLSFRWMLRKP